MPSLGFSGANLAIVAYAEVEGSAGASTACNSGVTTTRTSSGTYVVILPTGLAQPSSRDLILVQPKLGAASPPGAPLMAVVDDTLDATKVVRIWSGNPAAASSTATDADFSILILRTTITPPSGSPA